MSATDLSPHEYHARRAQERRTEREALRLEVLERNIQADLRTIEGLYGELGEPELGESEEQERLIVIAYRLHGLYSAFENIFRNISSAFENHRDPSGWRRQLLRRMRLDLSPVRPAVIDESAYDKLEELRRFRHVFRTNYGTRLDPLRLQLALRRTLELKPVYRQQIERFLEFLRTFQQA